MISASADTTTPTEAARPDRIDTGPAVRNGVLRYVSVSQIQSFDTGTFGGCHRRWWFDKVGNVPREETVAQREGKRIHGEIEHYLKSGEDVLSMTTRQAKHFFPDRRLLAQLLIEHPIGTAEAVNLCDEFRARCEAVDRNGNDGADVYEAQQWIRDVFEPATAEVLMAANDVPVIGYIDLVNGSGLWVDTEGVERVDTADVELVDWKTTSSIAEHAKSADALAVTAQMIGYGAWMHKVAPDLETFRMSHGYIQTKGRGADKRSKVIHLDVVQDKWESVTRIVRAMKDVAREPDVKNVEPHYASCTAYRGCPYKTMCPRSPEQVLIELFGKVPDALRKAGAGASAESASESSTKPESQVESKAREGERIMGMMDRLLGRTPSAGATPATPPSPAPAPTAAPVPPTPPPAPAPPAPSASDVAAERARIEAEEAALKAGAAATDDRGTCSRPGCNTKLTPENSSRLPNGQVIHIPNMCSDAVAANAVAAVRAEKSKSGVLPPDAPTSSPTLKADVVPPEQMGLLPPEVRAKAEEHAKAVAAAAAGNAPVSAAASATPPEVGVVATPDAGSGQSEEHAAQSGRKCSACGEVGHTSRSPKCPKKGAVQEKGTGAQGQDAGPLALPPGSGQAAAQPEARLASGGVEAPAASSGGVVTFEPMPMAADHGIRLYVDCIVEGVECRSLDGYVARKAAELAEAAGIKAGIGAISVADIRMAGQDNPLGFGKWKAAFKAAIEDELPPPGSYVMCFIDGNELNEIAIAALKPHCTMFVRSRR